MPDIKTLQSGIESFAKRNCYEGSAYNQTVTKGQKPKIMIVSCSDSMVDPAVLMNAGPGELFIHRNIAGLVPPYQPEERDKHHGTSAVIEYGITGLNVEHLIVLGHGNCGGIKSMIQDHIHVGHDSFVAAWMRIAEPALDALKKETTATVSLEKQQHICEKESIILSLTNLMTFPWIQERVVAGDLQLHGWHFDRGIFSIYNKTLKQFE